MHLVITTEHLYLRPNAPNHLLALIEHPEQYEQLTGTPAAPGLRAFFVSDDVSPAFLTNLRALHEADPWRFGFAIVHQESMTAIGTAGFKGPSDSAGVVEVAYGIVPAFEGRGYATQATSALVDYAFRDESVQLVRAHTLPTPNASTRVLKKCGFVFVGDVIDPEDGPVWRWERGERSGSRVS